MAAAAAPAAASAKLIYGVVAHDACIVAETTGAEGNNFDAISGKILEKIDTRRNDRKSYAYGKYTFHYTVDGAEGYVYMVMADERCSIRLAFGYLADIQNKFKTTVHVSDRKNADDKLCLQDQFGKLLEAQLKQFNSDPGADKIATIQSQIKDVQNIMVENIEKVLERGERIEILVGKTDELNSQAQKFKKQSTQLKRAMWWKNMKLWAIIIIIVIIIIIIIVAAACANGACSKKT